MTRATAEFSQKGSFDSPPVLTIISDTVDVSVSSSKDWKSISAKGFHFADEPSFESGSNFMTFCPKCFCRHEAVKFQSSPFGSKRKMLCRQQRLVGTILHTPLPERVGATSRICSGPSCSSIFFVKGLRPTTKPDFAHRPALAMSFFFAQPAVPWLVMRFMI